MTFRATPANTTSYTWTGLTPGTYLCFNIRSCNAAGYSAWTPWACTTTP
ncbi:fibronectin type III domain-containing protein [Solwaraspora sp. WMMD791]|nr:fibronectin type III domain-containing protein [Solwaraspora sp. WMMD791]WFE30333.1 fibronectin type III domain-containing protein [Solwaraspora sp. WMMD791]